MLILKRPWTSQPLTPAVNPHGFLRGAKLLWLASAPTLDFSPANRPGWVNVGYSPKITQYGPAYAVAGANTSYIGIPETTRTSDVSGPITLVWVGRRDADSSAAYDTFLSNRGGTFDSTNSVALNIWGAGGADLNKPYFEVWSSANVQYYTTIQSQVAIPSTRFSVVIGVWDGATVKCYQDGVLVSTSSAAATLTTRSEPWRIGSRVPSAGSPGMQQTVILAGALNGARSAAEVADFSAGVEAYLRHLTPQQRYIPTAAAASGLPTLSAPTYVPGSITSSGWRPRFTATY